MKKPTKLAPRALLISYILSDISIPHVLSNLFLNFSTFFRSPILDQNGYVWAIKGSRSQNGQLYQRFERFERNITGPSHSFIYIILFIIIIIFPPSGTGGNTNKSFAPFKHACYLALLPRQVVQNPFKHVRNANRGDFAPWLLLAWKSPLQRVRPAARGFPRYPLIDAGYLRSFSGTLGWYAVMWLAPPAASAAVFWIITTRAHIRENRILVNLAFMSESPFVFWCESIITHSQCFTIWLATSVAFLASFESFFACVWFLPKKLPFAPVFRLL